MFSLKESLFKKVLGILSPPELVPIIAIEDLPSGGSVILLSNYTYVFPFKLSLPSFEGMTYQQIVDYNKEFSLLLNELYGLSKGIMISFSYIRRPIKEVVSATGKVYSEDKRRCDEFRETHNPSIFVNKRLALVESKSFAVDIFGAITLKESPEKAIKYGQKALKIVNARGGKPLSAREAIHAIYTHFQPWRTIPDSKYILDFPLYFMSSEASLVADDPSIVAYDGRFLSSLQLINIFGIEEDGHGSIAYDAFAFLNKLNFPFRYFINIFIGDQQKEKQSLRNRKGSAQTLGRNLERNKEKANTIQKMLEEISRTGDLVVRFSSGFVLWEKEKTVLEENITRLTKHASSNGLAFFREEVSAIKTTFNQSVPFLAAAHAKTKLFTTGMAASVMIPKYRPFQGNEAHFLVTSRYRTPVGFSLVSRRSPKWGTVVIAPSGSGKTFFMNNLFLYLLSLKNPPFVVIMDMATRPSYLGLVNAFNGLYIKVDFNSHAAVNPLEFRFPLMKCPSRHIAFLVEKFFPAILDRKLQPEERAALEMALSETYEVFFRKESPSFSPKRVEDSDFYDHEDFKRYETFLEAKNAFLEQENIELAELAHRQMMPTLADFVQILGSSTKIRSTFGEEIVDTLVRSLTAYVSGPYGAFFSSITGGNYTIDYNNPLIYIEMAPILNYPTILPAVFLLLRNYLIEQTTIFAEDEYFFEKKPVLQKLALKLMVAPKIFTYDEWHNLKHHKLALSAVDFDFRQGRTMRRVPLLVSQSAKDVDEESILVNTANKILLAHVNEQNPDETALMHAKEVFQLDKRLEDLLQSVRFEKGQYSEALIISEGAGAGVIRLYPTPEEIWAITSDAVSLGIREKVIQMFQEKGFSYRKAFQKAVEVLAKLAPREVFEGTEEEFLEKVKKFTSRNILEQ